VADRAADGSVGTPSRRRRSLVEELPSGTGAGER
jgi:hypothetical protein